jgi:hypothetical protein
MPVMVFVTVVVISILLGVIVAMYTGLRDWGRRKQDATESRWRKVLNLVGLVLVSLAALLFFVYVTHNMVTGGDRGGNATTTALIKTGNALSFSGIVLGLTGKGTSRWAAVVSGFSVLFLWFWQGISL